MRTARFSLWPLALLILGGTCAAWAQVGLNAGTEPVNEPAPRYSITVAGERAIMLDAATGQSWLLTDSPIGGESPAWLPLERIEDADAASRWREADRVPTADQELSFLLKQMSLLQKRLSTNHPRIQELQEQIELVRQRLNREQSEAATQISSALEEQLFPLLLEEVELLQTHGPDHPIVKRLRTKIEVTRSFLMNESGEKGDK